MSSFKHILLLFQLLVVPLIAYDLRAEELIEYFENPTAEKELPLRINTADRIAVHGYPVETHSILTEDDYILTVFRIPYSHKLGNQNQSRSIVLINHGLLSSSDGWVITGPNDGLPFLLADGGFDVWLINARGTHYGRNHTTLSPRQREFWRFSWHEIGYYDLPAIIDYALGMAQSEGNPQRQVHFIGHSQGTTTFFVLLTARPEYNEKIKTAHMLAPVVYLRNLRDQFAVVFAPILGHPGIYAQSFSSKEFLPSNELFLFLNYQACQADSQFMGLCSAIAFMVEGSGSPKNETALIYFAQTHPAGSSTDQLIHYFQEEQSGQFRQYDFGSRKNMAIYGQGTPPDYPLELVTTQLHLWYGDNDQLAVTADVEYLASMLQNRILHHIPDSRWDHGDFVYAPNVREVIFDPILGYLLEYEQTMPAFY